MSAGWAGGTVKVWADLQAQGPQCLTVCSRTSHTWASGCPVPIRSGPDPGGGWGAWESQRGPGHSPPAAPPRVRVPPLCSSAVPGVTSPVPHRRASSCLPPPPPPEQHRQLQPSSKLFNEQAFILAQLIHFARLSPPPRSAFICCAPKCPRTRCRPRPTL